MSRDDVAGDELFLKISPLGRLTSQPFVHLFVSSVRHVTDVTVKHFPQPLYGRAFE
jgi:hypothetical protein